MTAPQFILLMGVSGCGKSTVGPLLAAELGGVYVEGDDLHPPENKQKMGSGVPLEDTDRLPWFDRIREAVKDWRHRSEEPCVVACSALKRRYRESLFHGFDESDRKLVYMQGSRELIAGRLTDRQHEYMPASLLDSQFAALEEPAAEENALEVSIDAEAGEIVDSILNQLLKGSGSVLKPWRTN